MSDTRQPHPAAAVPHDLRARILTFARSRRFHPASAERWCALSAADAAALMEVADAVRPGENQWRDVFECAEEIAAREGGSLADVLQSPAVRAALSRRRGRNDALRALREALRRLRFPQLAAAEAELRERIRELDLPASVRLVLPENLQDDELRVELRGRSSEDLDAALDRLKAALRLPAFAGIFARLREAP